MDEREIIKVAKIMLTADSWCGACSNNLLDELVAAFPEHQAAIETIRAQGDEIEGRFWAAQDAWHYGPEEQRQRVMRPRVWNV